MDTNTPVILVNLPPVRFQPEDRERMAQLSNGREIIQTTDRAEIEKVLDRIEIYICFGTRDSFDKMPRLRWIQSWSAGVNNIIADSGLMNRPVMITTGSGIHTEQVNEHIFALIFAWSRKLPKVLAAQKERKWLQITNEDVDVIARKTMLILGYGTIGEQCAKIALSFGMKVIGLRRHQSESISGIQIETADKLHILLPQADYVVNILPLTHNTKNIMAAKEFGLMKQSSVYVNVGRGPTTDEAALINALKTGQIAAALLDVTAEEPLPEDSPLWHMDNVIITPHYAGTSPDYSSKAMEITLENLKRYNNGETLINLLNKNEGY
jgi:phosphoglycerate dehydrogenase-like enzyme